jgi:hypothetical protein
MYWVVPDEWPIVAHATSRTHRPKTLCGKSLTEVYRWAGEGDEPCGACEAVRSDVDDDDRRPERPAWVFAEK